MSLLALVNLERLQVSGKLTPALLAHKFVIITSADKREHVTLAPYVHVRACSSAHSVADRQHVVSKVCCVHIPQVLQCISQCMSMVLLTRSPAMLFEKSRSQSKHPHPYIEMSTTTKQQVFCTAQHSHKLSASGQAATHLKAVVNSARFMAWPFA